MPGRVKFMGMLMWTRKSSLGRYRVVLSSSGGRYLLYIAACEVCQGENSHGLSCGLGAYDDLGIGG